MNSEVEKQQRIRDSFVAAEKLCSEVFPMILNAGSGKTGILLNHYSLKLGVSMPTLRRKYYQWRHNMSPYSIVDQRLVRSVIVPDDQVFRDFMSYFHKRKSAAIAYNDMRNDYSRDGKVLPSGFSLVNLRRYAKRIASEKFKTIQPDDMPERCVNCEQLFQQLDRILLNLCEIQKPCKNCDLLVTK